MDLKIMFVRFAHAFFYLKKKLKKESRKPVADGSRCQGFLKKVDN